MIRIALRSAFPGQLLKPLLRRKAVLQHFGRIGVSQLIKRKPAALRNLLRAVHGIRIAPKGALRLLRRFQKLVGVLLLEEARLVDGGLQLNAGDNIL